MAEPPAKRARRTDSAAMWDTNEKRSRQSYSPEPEADSRHGSSRPEDTRKGTRDDRRYRSRSRDRYARKRDRSASRDRYERPRDGTKRDSQKDGRGMRDRDRSTSRDRYYSRRGYDSKPGRPDRSRSPRNGGRSRRDLDADYRDEKRDPRSRNDNRRANGTSKRDTRDKITDEEDGDHVDMMSDIEDPDDVEAMMKKAMGFSRFRTTKNTKVPGNDIYGVRKEKQTEYRQYMNRTGGFNRPLSPGRG